jgi:hypothetical protein
MEVTMATDPDGLGYWKTLYEAWQVCNEEAREARAIVLNAYVKALAGEGPGPTVAQRDEALMREAYADKMAVELDRLVTNRMG